jgi:hypothetical protein
MAIDLIVALQSMDLTKSREQLRLLQHVDVIVISHNANESVRNT